MLKKVAFTATLSQWNMNSDLNLYNAINSLLWLAIYFNITLLKLAFNFGIYMTVNMCLGANMAHIILNKFKQTICKILC